MHAHENGRSSIDDYSVLTPRNDSLMMGVKRPCSLHFPRVQHRRNGDITSEDIRSKPVVADGHTIPRRKKHGEVHRAPHEEARSAGNARLADGAVQRSPERVVHVGLGGHFDHALSATDVRHLSLVVVLELDSLFALGELVTEGPAEVLALLRRDLGGGGQPGDGAVPNRVDIFCSKHTKVLVDLQATARILAILSPDLRHELLRQRTARDACSPDEHAVVDGAHPTTPGLDASLRLAHLRDEHVGLNRNVTLFEVVLRVGSKLLVEHGQDAG
mmetsp:Transcript_16482/g.32218  ORF Transcript_16482/g.32218 Transcript_16482/m.32218 type:complete len:273 (-) Transcript_16482:14-832(-)